MNKKANIIWTPAFQNYYSAGDESEPFCGECETYVEDNFNYCPGCGLKLIWNEYEEDEG